MGRSTSAEFKKAFEDVKNLAGEPSQNEKLDLYAYAKIAQDEDIEAKKPGMFDIKGKTMKNAWQAKLDEGVTPDQADKKYVDLVASLQKTYGKK